MAQYLSLTSRSLACCRPVLPAGNLSDEERTALSNLKKNKCIIITKADKGDTVVVMDTTQYTGLAYGHLNDPQTYTRLTGDPTPGIAKGFRKFIHNLYTVGVIDETTLRFLQPPSDVRTQHMYFLPKLHKVPLKVRPIVACCGGPTEAASAFLDTFLQPVMVTVQSFVANSTDVIRKLDSLRIPQDCLLATLDVASLYTNISHDDALDAVRAVYDRIPTPHLPPVDVLLQLLAFVLKNNVFTFNGECYHQRYGVAMGTKLAPALATIFMALLEERYLESTPNPPLFYARYIDDIFLIWNHGRPDLDAFVRGLNNLKPRIKFTSEVSEDRTVFLDLTIYKGPRFAECSKLDTEIYYKTTNNFTYVHGRSHHPPHVYKAVARGETLRILRNCSDTHTFSVHKNNLMRKLKERGFPRSAIREARQIVFSTRQVALNGDLRNAEDAEGKPNLFFVSKFIKTKPTLTSVLHKHWLAIESNPHLSRRFPVPPMVSHTNFRPLRGILRNNKFNLPNLIPPCMPPPSPFPMLPLKRYGIDGNACTNHRCLICPIRHFHTVVRSRNNSLFPIDTSLTCTSKCVVYALQCKHCAKQYVGQTSYDTRHRMSGHRYAFGKIHKSLYYHFIKIHKSTFDVRIILLQSASDRQLRLKAENEWIEKLDTLLPRGLNTRSNINLELAQYSK